MQSFNSKPLSSLEIHPATPERWPDLETLFGKQGATGGCWCMWWRIPRSQFNLGGESNRQAMKDLVESGKVPGLIACVGGAPVGWVSVAPREEYGALERSRTLKRLDDQPVWSIVCFYINRSYRGRGLMTGLIRAAVDYAVEHGARMVEAYPVAPEGRVSPGELYTGLFRVYSALGFVEMMRPAPRRLIMRLTLPGV